MLNEPTEGRRHGSYRVNPAEKLPGLSKDAEIAGTHRPPAAIEEGDELNSSTVPALARFHAFLGKTCCCDFVDKVPMILIGIAIAIVITLLIALIPAILLLTNSSASEPQAQIAEGIELKGFRNGFRMMPVSEDELDKSDEGSGVEAIEYAISMAGLMPKNVSVCSGFGFFCTNEPHIMISTDHRCDGHNDCSDESDEKNCLECQTPHSCSLYPNASSSIQICIRSSQLCDGVKHCPDGSDENSKYCGPDCNEDEEMRCEHVSGRGAVCLPTSAICDGTIDCKGGMDEANCSECSGKAKMCLPTSECIGARRTCDGSIDCPDGSDEQDCDCRACCGNDRALCGDGTCIDREQVCDGIVDCLDGFDEMDCPGSCPANSQYSKPTVLCADGKRYLQSEACAGLIDVCYSNCNSTCDGQMAFTCGDGSCIPKNKVCNGFSDCGNNEDEADCNNSCQDDSNFFQCSNTTKCIPSSQRCNGVWNCEDGSDEFVCENCPFNSVRCERDNTCHPPTARCDGFAHCSDGWDESDCTCEECTGRHSSTYMCEGSNRCFKRQEVCSPYSLCPNATLLDKIFCAGIALRGYA